MPSKIARPALVVILLSSMGLSGCMSLPSATPASQDSSVSISTRSIDLLNRARQRERVKLVKGDVVVRAPDGYCIERSSRSENDFVLMGDCNVLRKAETGLEPYERGLLTVSAGPANATPPSLATLAEGLESFGDPQRRGNLVTVRISEGGDRLVTGADSVYWRGVTVINNRVVSLAAFGPPYSDIAHSKGRGLLTALSANIHAESPKLPTDEIRVAAAPSAAETNRNAGGSVFDFFGRMLQKN